MRLLWSNFCIYVIMMLFSFSVFSDRRSLKIENKNNNTKTLPTESPYYSRVPSVHFTNIETYPGWLEPIFIVPSLFESLKFYCNILNKGSDQKHSSYFVNFLNSSIAIIARTLQMVKPTGITTLIPNHHSLPGCKPCVTIITLMLLFILGWLVGFGLTAV